MSNSVEIDDASDKNYLIGRKLTENKEKMNLNMETNISYQLAFIFDKFCIILRHKTRKYTIC